MERSITFQIADLNDVQITVTEEASGALRVDIVNTTGAALDLRAVYFDLTGFEHLTGGLSVSGDQVEAFKFGESAITKVGGGTSISGEVVNEFGAFDAGAAIDSGDASSASFTISHGSEALDIDMLSLADFGLRLDGGVPKWGDTSTMALLARDDSFAMDENAVRELGNVLADDRGSTGLAVTEVQIDGVPLSLGEWTVVTTLGGRTGLVRIDADGGFQFDTQTGFDDLGVGDTDRIEFTYGSTDAFGSRDGATITLTINGTNDGPEVAGALAVTTDEDAAQFTVDLLEGATDVDAGAVLSVADLVETSGQGGWTAEGNTILVDPAQFDGLAQGQATELTFEFNISDEWGAMVAQTLSVTVEGRNDAPTTAAPLALRVSEEDAVFSVDLLEGAADVDAGAVLSAANLVESGGQGGWTIEGDQIVIDPDYFDDLNDGDLGVLEFIYDVTDEFGATASQTLTVEVEGYTDAPLIDVVVRRPDDASGANVVELVVTTEQARDEDVTLRFSGLPEGAVLLDALGGDASQGVTDAIGETIYRLELPLGADVPEITVTVVGSEPDGTEIGTRDAVVALGYDATTVTTSLAFTADDVDLWGSDEAFFYSISEYIPLLGGERKFFELTGATSQTGQVFLDFDEIKWLPDDTYDGLETGVTATEIVTFTYREMTEDPDGNLVTDPSAPELVGQFEVTVTGGNFATEYSGDYVKMRDAAVILDPLKTIDVLHDPLSTGKLELIDIDLNSDDIFASVIEPLLAARNGFDTLLAEDQAKLDAARADADAATEKFELLTQLTGQRAEVFALDVAYKTAAFAAASIDGALTFFENAVDDAQAILSGAQSALNSAKTNVSNKKAAYDASVKSVFGVKVGDPIKWTAYKAAQAGQAAAQTTVNLANKGLDAAEDALEFTRDNLNADFLEQQETNALAALNAAKSDVTATENALESKGYYNNASALDTGELALELAEATGELTLAQGEVIFYEATTLGLTALRNTAQEVVNVAEGIIATTDFQASLYAAAEAYAQAGFQFDFAISGGTVDAQVDYDMTTIAGYNAATDVMSIEVMLENMTTGEDVAFVTASPNVQVYAGLLYDLGANFEFVVDFYAAILDVVLADLSPDSDGIGITPMPNFEGSLDFIDFDSRDGAGIQFGISSGGDISPDFLTFNIAVPSIETQGTAADPSLEYYNEGDLVGVDFSELLGSVKNLLEARIDFSPELKALLNQQGANPDDPFGGEFGQVLADVLGVIVASASGAGDTDGDGVVPLFLLDATDDTEGAFLHINSVPDDLSGLDETTLGEFGFYAGYGESGSFLKVTLDVDQLIATLVNRAAANPSPVVVNPFDLELDFNDINEGEFEFLDFDLNAEFADLDVALDFGFNQQFTLALNQFDFIFTMEDGTAFTQTASDPMLTVEDASKYDANGDGQIDYALGITPSAEFFNDTEVGMGFNYALDLIKTSLRAGINIPLEKVFGADAEFLGLADTLEIDFFNAALGPVFRVQGDVDVATLDVFEKRFEIDLGTTLVDLSIEGVETPGDADADVFAIA